MADCAPHGNVRNKRRSRFRRHKADAVLPFSPEADHHHQGKANSWVTCETNRLADRTLLTIQPITRPAAMALTIAHGARPMNRSKPKAASPASTALTQDVSHKSPTSSVSDALSSAILIKSEQRRTWSMSELRYIRISPPADAQPLHGMLPVAISITIMTAHISSSNNATLSFRAIVHLAMRTG